jgi:NNP family nitrate/nitrite transporter-like MFS transporter
MGIGKAAVYKYIPEYFPSEVGVVGGMVGVIGGLGGFVCPIIFGYLLRGIGLWTTTWVFFFIVAIVCLIWLHLVVRRISARETHIESLEPNATSTG